MESFHTRVTKRARNGKDGVVKVKVKVCVCVCVYVELLNKAYIFGVKGNTFSQTRLLAAFPPYVSVQSRQWKIPSHKLYAMRNIAVFTLLYTFFWRLRHSEHRAYMCAGNGNTQVGGRSCRCSTPVVEVKCCYTNIFLPFSNVGRDSGTNGRRQGTWRGVIYMGSKLCKKYYASLQITFLTRIRWPFFHFGPSLRSLAYVNILTHTYANTCNLR